jgi:hypothetical protein
MCASLYQVKKTRGRQKKIKKLGAKITSWKRQNNIGLVYVVLETLQGNTR